MFIFKDTEPVNPNRLAEALPVRFGGGFPSPLNTGCLTRRPVAQAPRRRRGEPPVEELARVATRRRGEPPIEDLRRGLHVTGMRDKRQLRRGLPVTRERPTEAREYQLV